MVIWDTFTTKKIVVTKKEKLESRCEVWKYKWNTRWNILCVKIVAIISFTLFIAYVIHRNVTAIHSQEDIRMRSITKIAKYFYNKQKNNRDNQCTYTSCTEYGYDNLCCFNCKSFTIKQYTINEIIGNNADYNENNCRDKLVLKLENCSFPENKINSNWFQDSTIPISQLVIIKGNLEDIEDGAFNVNLFKKLKRFTLQFPTILNYRKNMFRGLSNLEYFEIQNSLAPTFEDGVLEYVANSIIALQIIASELDDPISIKNLTSVYLPNLLLIDLRFNTYLHSLPSNSFHNVPKLLSIYLQGNSFQTLHEYNFISVLQTISIENNDWRCSCELYWLQNITNIIGLNTTKCLEGKQSKNFGTIFEKNCVYVSTTDKPSTTVSFTTSSISTTTKDTTPQSTSTTITSSITHEALTSTSSTLSSPLTTLKEVSSTPEDISPAPTETTLSTALTDKETDDEMLFPNEEKYTCMKNMQNELDIFQRNGKIVVQYPNPKVNANYYFFHTKNIRDCSILGRRIEGNFEPDTNYTFCEASTDDGSIQCLSGRTLPIYADQTWLTNQQKMPVILIGIFVILLSILFTGILTYCYLRKHPSLLERKKSQPTTYATTPKPMYFSNPTPHVFTASRIPREELHLRRHAPYVPVREHSVAYVSVGDASYFSPISERYMYLRQKPPLHRSVSDLSLKTIASYVTENQITSWRKRSKKERQPVANLFEAPPPLPPPRIKNNVVHEN